MSEVPEQVGHSLRRRRWWRLPWRCRCQRRSVAARARDPNRSVAESAKERCCRVLQRVQLDVDGVVELGQRAVEHVVGTGVRGQVGIGLNPYTRSSNVVVAVSTVGTSGERDGVERAECRRRSDVGGRDTRGGGVGSRRGSSATKSHCRQCCGQGVSADASGANVSAAPTAKPPDHSNFAHVHSLCLSMISTDDPGVTSEVPPAPRCCCEPERTITNRYACGNPWA